MALVQVRLVPVYRRLSFSPGFLAFTFSYAATAIDALVWLTLKKPAGSIGYAVVVVAAMTGFIAWIAVRTVMLAVRGELFPVTRPS